MKIKFNVIELINKVIHLQTEDFNEASEYVTNYNLGRKAFKVVIIKTRANQKKGGDKK